MTNVKQIIFSFYLFLVFANFANAQTVIKFDYDADLKAKLYKKLRNQTLNFSKKQFDSVFFDYFRKEANKKVLLTKDEYYNYTIRIAIYSEKLGLLYNEQKKDAQQSKKDWYEKMYQDYVNSKK